LGSEATPTLPTPGNASFTQVSLRRAAFCPPRARLLIVDFDHSQRQHGLPALRANIEAGLDHGAAQGDIHCIGDAGNISYGTFFSGI
jgi:hypothetical protein